jgi:energy-converting hydrogenase Eha subunit A
MTAAVALIVDTDAVLDRAADYLQQHGWIPAGLYDPHDGCIRNCSCHRTGAYPASIIGAIRAVIFGPPRWYLDTADPAARHAYTAAVEWLNTYLIAIGHAGLHAPVFDWQTTPGRTCADVLGALHDAASAYRHHHERRAA